METVGTVRFWLDEEGWGVVDSDATPGGCWARFTHLAVPGYRTLLPGDTVSIEWEAGDQDGFKFRATRLWPLGQEPAPDVQPESPGNAYGSGLAITFDEQ